MSIGKLLFWICLMLFVCVFEKLLILVLMVIAVYLGTVIVKRIKVLK